MPWNGVTVNEERQRFLQEFRLGYYSVSDLADRFSISRQTAHKWIRRLEHYGQTGFHELSRRPYNSPCQTDPAITQELIPLRKAHPAWGARKLLDLMQHRHSSRQLPSPSTACRILLREGLVRSRRRFRRAHPGCPKSVPQDPARRFRRIRGGGRRGLRPILLLLPDRALPLAVEQDRGCCPEGTCEPAPDRPGPQSVSDVLTQICKRCPENVPPRRLTTRWSPTRPARCSAFVRY